MGFQFLFISLLSINTLLLNFPTMANEETTRSLKSLNKTNYEKIQF